MSLCTFVESTILRDWSLEGGKYFQLLHSTIDLLLYTYYIYYIQILESLLYVHVVYTCVDKSEVGMRSLASSYT